MFSPYLTCPSGKEGLTRLGSDGEGGKWICTDMLERGKNCAVFSLGSNGMLQKSVVSTRLPSFPSPVLDYFMSVIIIIDVVHMECRTVRI